MKQRLFEKLLAECPVVAILRGITPAEVPSVCDCLFENGIRLLEIPLNTPQAVKSIATAVRHCSERQMVGAGTVLTPCQVREVQAAGAQFWRPVRHLPEYGPGSHPRDRPPRDVVHAGVSDTY